jgi:bifunctional non-homologous end joining protein LigD
MPKSTLSAYRAKRDFTKTTEPSGEVKIARSKQPRFVIQKHAARQLHYDLRLEFDGVFKSWAVARGPSVDPADKRLAVEVEDHPLDYGDFEGTIPKGEYGGGTVQLWDRGFWQVEGDKSAAEAFAGGDLKIKFNGARMRGSWVLVRMRTDRFGGKRPNWLLIKHRDEFAMPGEGDALLHEDSSVASGRTLEQIGQGVGQAPKPFILAQKERGRADAVWHSAVGGEAKAKPQPPGKRLVKELPAFVEPQLCKAVTLPTPLAGWGHEVKLDGYRTQLKVERGRAALRTRTGLDWTERFAALADAARALPACILDGEVVAQDEKGLPNFSALQAALAAETSTHLLYFAFDLLFEGREDLRELPLAERKSRLQGLLKRLPADSPLRYVQHLESNGHEVFASAQKMQLEGIVSKKLDAPYRSGRVSTWTKAKCRPAQEVVIGGFTSEAGEVRSLLAGVYRSGVLQYVGRVGTGFGRELASSLGERLARLNSKFNPFAGANIPAIEAKIRWVRPELVAEIEFAGFTDDGMIRQAAFKGLREDKAARKVTDEVAMPQSPPRQNTPPAKSAPGLKSVLGVTISHPDKVLWPKSATQASVSKVQLAEYYEAVGPWMLQHLAGRPCSLMRMPEGIGGERFFQRHAAAGMPDSLGRVEIRGDKAPYVQIDTLDGLAAAAQFGALELHPWNCAPGNPEVAGRLVFDLDPAPDVPFAEVIVAALEVRERLERLGLVSFCKTTGGKGLHVVTPLTYDEQSLAWPVAKNFAHLVCAQMVGDSPQRYLDVMSKSQRAGKIFLDYLRNDRTSTAVAVLSPRAREAAPVSMPVHWKAVRTGLDATTFTVHSAPALLKKTKPWEDYAQAHRSLADAVRTLTKGETAPAGPRAVKKPVGPSKRRPRRAVR